MLAAASVIPAALQHKTFLPAFGIYILCCCVILSCLLLGPLSESSLCILKPAIHSHANCTASTAVVSNHCLPQKSKRNHHHLDLSWRSLAPVECRRGQIEARINHC
mmetsp:Transcript_6768/g.10034  ORF Transcript_6768/g.10034 Transcript_6768/m.10034 type:complete len:106 (+) Transcript_6768:23-340(+)